MRRQKDDLGPYCVRKKMPQAIICANDSMAIAAMKALEEHGIKTPEDIIVTGFDAIYQERIYSTTRLTTAQMDADELATTIADTAYGYIKGSENRAISISISL